ncbi:hypothetical protein M3Y95_00483100 [Aphelenchoides besseyi]|nr:hypothetical protein M3Y95_00483100 [Aphelenchoides besseyi]
MRILQQMVVWIQGECKDIDKLQKASLSIPCTQLLYEFKIRTPESKKVVKQLVKEILETTKFNQEHSANIITKPKDYNNYVLIKQHYDVELWRKQSNCHAILQFTIDIKPVISEDESTEDNDN